MRGGGQGSGMVVSSGRNPEGIGLGGGDFVRFNPLSYMIGGNVKRVLQVNRNRSYLMVQNQSTVDIYVGFGVKVDIFGNNGFLIPAGGFYEMDTVVHNGSVYIVSTAAQSRVLVIEGAVGER